MIRLEVKIVFTTDIFIYENSEVFEGGGGECRMNLFIEQRTAKHHNKHQANNTADPRYFSQERCENVLRGELPLRTTNAKTTLTKNERRKI